MLSKLLKATEKAIARVVVGFQSYPDRFWNERDIHWSLFWHLKGETVIQETYVTELIRAEFPTLKKFGTRNPARGHYDLVILEPHSYNSPDVQKLKADASWDDFLKLVKIAVAVEIKLWLFRRRRETAELAIQWDVQKLTEWPNNVLHAFFLNFVQLNFGRPGMRVWYQELRDILTQHKKRQPRLNILCVPSDISVQPELGRHWLSL